MGSRYKHSNANFTQTSPNFVNILYEFIKKKHDITQYHFDSHNVRHIRPRPHGMKLGNAQNN